MEMRTILLVDKLVEIGFTEEAFQKLHHMGENASIKSFRNYCAKVSFRPNGTNALFVKRLEHILATFLLGNFTKQETWLPLAEAVLIEIPFEGIEDEVA